MKCVNVTGTGQSKKAMDGYGYGYGLVKKMDDGYGFLTRLRTPGYGLDTPTTCGFFVMGGSWRWWGVVRNRPRDLVGKVPP